jgi:hypothetical protein
MATQTPASRLYDLLSSRDFEVEVLDTKTGNPPVDPDTGDLNIGEGDLFVFDWEASSGKNYGTAEIFIDGEGTLNLYYGDNLGRGMDPEDKNEWYSFMEQLKNFATRNWLNFAPGNISKFKHALRSMSAVKESILESYYGNRKVSYAGAPTEARLMIKHNRDLAEGDARFRYVESLYIETTDGERFKLPFRNLAGGRAMLEHVRNGGRPYDPRGTHISSIVEELSVLNRFRKAHHGRVFEGHANDLVERSNHYFESLRKTVKGLSTHRGYNSYFESWQPLDLREEDTLVEELKQLFIEQTLDTRIEQALPVLARLQRTDAMKETQEFAAHIQKVVEGTWAIPDTPEAQQTLVDLLNQPTLPVGPDAEDLTAQLYDIIGDDELYDQLQDLANVDADADAKSIILARLEELKADPGVAKVLAQVVRPDQEPQQQPQQPQQQQQQPTSEADNLATFEAAGCNMTAEGEECPMHGLEECGMYGPAIRESEEDLARLKQLIGKI